MSLVLIIAAVTGNTTNYHIGRWIGPPAFSGQYRFLKVEYLQRTEAFFQKYGAMTIVLSRFVPIIRTCAPFVAGIGRMPYGRFQAYNVAGGLGWVLVVVWAGLLLRQHPAHQGQLRPRDDRHHRGVPAAGGVDGARK